LFVIVASLCHFVFMARVLVPYEQVILGPVPHSGPCELELQQA
jgi:hypothetical protein